MQFELSLISIITTVTTSTLVVPRCRLSSVNLRHPCIQGPFDNYGVDLSG